MTMVKFFLHAIKAGMTFYALTSIPLIIILTFFNYLKKGYVNKWVLFVTSIFAVYISVTFFIVMWPFPDKRLCLNTSEFYYQTYGHINILPLSFVRDFIRDLNHHYNVSSIVHASKGLVNTFLNIIMFVPLGMYFAYIYKFKIRGIILVGFFSSLFIEIMQLSGFLGYYNCQWRLFEIDDLMTNTFGSIVGWWIYRKTMRWYYDVDTLDHYEINSVNGKMASTFRIFFANCFDIFTVLLLIFTTFTLLGIEPTHGIQVYIAYRIVVIWFMNGRHLGLWLTRVHIYSIDDENNKLQISEKIKLTIYLSIIIWAISQSSMAYFIIIIATMTTIFMKRTLHTTSVLTSTRTIVKLKDQKRKSKHRKPVNIFESKIKNNFKGIKHDR